MRVPGSGFGGPCKEGILRYDVDRILGPQESSEILIGGVTFHKYFLFFSSHSISLLTNRNIVSCNSGGISRNQQNTVKSSVPLYPGSGAGVLSQTPTGKIKRY